MDSVKNERTLDPTKNVTNLFFEPDSNIFSTFVGLNYLAAGRRPENRTKSTTGMGKKYYQFSYMRISNIFCGFGAAPEKALKNQLEEKKRHLVLVVDFATYMKYNAQRLSLLT